MPDLKQRLLDYLETLTGVRFDVAAKSALALPLFLRERYNLLTIKLFERDYLLALEAADWDSGPPSEYGKHSDVLGRTLGAPVVLVLPILPSHARNRLVQMGVPFIVPGSQTFIPNSLIDLRERFPQPTAKRRDKLSPAAQCTLLYHLLRGPLGATPLKDIAEKLHYSPMMITNVKDELVAAEICQIVRSGRATVLNFDLSGRTLWDRVNPHLTSPVKKTRWVRWEKPPTTALLAGMSALSRRTLINDDRLPTFALTLPEFQKLLERGDIVGCQDAEDATAKIEIWSYDPHLLGNDQMADPLSLYLSFRASGDERVQQQINQLIEEFQW